MPHVDGAGAHTTLLNYAPLAMKGACDHYVAEAYGEHGAVYDHTTPNAMASWNEAKSKHYDRNPPFGKPVFLGRRNHDGDMNGDVFIAGPEDGVHAATDDPHWGATGLTSIEKRMELTDRVYLGWADDFMGNWIDSPQVQQIGKKMTQITVATSPAWEASGQRVIANGSSAQTIPSGWTQTLIEKGACDFVSFDNDSDLMAYANLNWILGDLNANAVASAIQELVAPVKGISPDDAQKAIQAHS